ncbi:hypothetical protein TNCV_4994201 [Trichonephila clavipes]|nr:hypothetical protein TNCV_4994201 [Trichonephila clavipes]
MPTTSPDDKNIKHSFAIYLNGLAEDDIDFVVQETTTIVHSLFVEVKAGELLTFINDSLESNVSLVPLAALTGQSLQIIASRQHPLSCDVIVAPPKRDGISTGNSFVLKRKRYQL